MINDWEIIMTSSDDESYAVYIPFKDTPCEKRVPLKEWFAWAVNEKLLKVEEMEQEIFTKVGEDTYKKEIKKCKVYTL